MNDLQEMVGDEIYFIRLDVQFQELLSLQISPLFVIYHDDLHRLVMYKLSEIKQMCYLNNII